MLPTSGGPCPGQAPHSMSQQRLEKNCIFDDFLSSCEYPEIKFEVTRKGSTEMHNCTKILSAVAVAAVFSVGSSAVAQDNVGPQLFANQYTQGCANSATAQMYVSPRPVPTWVGHTYITYQPFYPHEMLYRHTDRYHSYYDNGRGLNRTSVRYSAPPLRTMMGSMARSFSLPRP